MLLVEESPISAMDGFRRFLGGTVEEDVLLFTVLWLFADMENLKVYVKKNA